MIQSESAKDLEESCSQKLLESLFKHDQELSEGRIIRMKIVGRYKSLAPFMDKDGIWRVGSRARNFVPFTVGNKAAIFLPRELRYTLLKMKKEHHEHLGSGHRGCLVWSCSHRCCDGSQCSPGDGNAEEVRSKTWLAR